MPGKVCDPKDFAYLAFDARQSADLIESAIKQRVRAVNQWKARFKRLDEPDPEDLVRKLSSVPVIKRITDVRDQAKVDAYETVQQLPGYNFLMGVPGVGLGLICKLLGMVPMHGPHCVHCGEEDIPAVRDIVLCWPCQKIVEAGLLGKKCDSRIEDKKAPLGYRICDRPYTKSKFALVCPKCARIQHEFPHFSMFRKYVGNCPGHQRLVKGKPSEFHQRIKTYMFQTFSCLNKVAARVQGRGARGCYARTTRGC